jgi:hypothetical protein
MGIVIVQRNRMTDRHSIRATLLCSTIACLIPLILASCNGDSTRSADSSSAAVSDTAPSNATRFSPATFATLRWIEGDWRGQVPNGAHFYERYRFADDSTIVMRGFEDSTFSFPNDSATIVFRNGVVTDRGGKARWSAIRLDTTGVEFAPGQGATNHFEWTRKSADKWTAAIRPAKGNPTVYEMERVRQK